jgi:uncharacterized protein involved in oxidation of intracellular sulfur
MKAMIILTTGKLDRGARATLAFSWACSALSMGKPTTVFLTMDGAIWAQERASDGVQVAGFEPLSTYIEMFFSLGGKMLLCAPCAEYYCGVGSPQCSPQLWEDAQLAGLATVVGAASADCQLVTF